MFLNEFNLKYNKNILGFEPKLFDTMGSYDWPGNIRELKNKIEQSFVLCQQDWIKTIDIKQKIETNINTTQDQEIKNKDFFLVCCVEQLQKCQKP